MSEIRETPKGVDVIQAAKVSLEQERPAEILEDSLLGPFIHLLERSNEVRKAIRLGGLDNVSSEAAFEKIWEIHTGSSVKERADAFAEGIGPSQHEWAYAIERGITPDLLQGAVRVNEQLGAMLFTLPEPPKSKIVKNFFRLADELIKDPELIKHGMKSGAFAPAAVLQAYLRWLHPKIDANGRSSEDWMFWWQRQLVESARKISQSSEDDAVMEFLGISPQPEFTKDGIKSWYHHGLRARYGRSGGDYARVPSFLKEEYHQLYRQGRYLMEEVTGMQNELRRTMYKFLTEKLGYEGKPEDFEQYIKDHSEVVTEIFTEFYSDLQNLTSSPIYSLIAKLDQSGEYEYQVLSPQEVIKPEYLSDASSDD